MEWVDSIFELVSRATPEAGAVVHVGSVSRYRYDAESVHEADGVYVIEPAVGGGRWLRLGPPGLILTEAALGAKPSRARVRASGAEGSTTLRVRAARDFAAGDAVVVHNAGDLCRLEPPGAPQVRSATRGRRVLRYCAVAVGADRSFTAAGGMTELRDAPDDLSQDAAVEVEWAPDDVDPQAQLLIVYRQVQDAPWEAIAGMVANPYGLRDPRSSGSDERVRLLLHDVAFDDKDCFDRTTGRQRLRGLAAWLPVLPPDEPGRGQLATRVVEAREPDHLSLEAPLQASVANVWVHHDAAVPLQRAIDAFSGRGFRDGGRLHIPAGEYEVHDRVRIDKACLVEGDGALHTRLVFMDGWALEVESHLTNRRGLPSSGELSVLRDLTLEYKSKATVPAGNPVSLPSRTITAEDPEPAAAVRLEQRYSGALLLATARCEMQSVRVVSPVGSGIVLWGRPGLPDGSVHPNCNNSSLLDCSVSGATGHGFVAIGSESNNHAFIKANAVGCEGWGFLDMSQHGCHFHATHASANCAGAYRTTADIAAATYVGAYGESGVQPWSSAAQGTVVVGGTLGAPWRQRERSLKILQFDRPGIQPGLHIHHSDGGTATELGQWWAPGAARPPSELRRYSSDPDTYPSGKLSHVRQWVRGEGQAFIRDYFLNAVNVGREWLGSHVRGSGLMRYPRGQLWGERHTEIRLASATQTAIEFGAYDVGDVLFDASGDALCLRPRQRFVLGPPWRPNRRVVVGDTVLPTTPNGYGYVAVSVGERDGAGQTGTVEPPTWPTRTGQIVDDGDITWQCWGGDTADTITIGVAPRYHQLQLGTVPPGAHAELEVPAVGARFGDGVIASPSAPIDPRLVVAAFVAATDIVAVRVSNVGADPVAVPDQRWTIHLLSS